MVEKGREEVVFSHKTTPVPSLVVVRDGKVILAGPHLIPHGSEPQFTLPHQTEPGPCGPISGPTSPVSDSH